MLEINFLGAFLIGIAGGVHCIGMCGGIASAFSFAIPKGQSQLPYILSYNLGRILSYTLAGALTGFIGGIASVNIQTSIPILQIISIVFLVLLALYIGDWYKGLSALEALGAKVWKRISPISKKLIPFKNPIYTVAYGAIWGWLPCGLVYSVLTWSLASESVFQGALIMFSFGLGTLPTLIATSIGAGFLVPIFQHRVTRKIISLFLLCFALILTLKL
ncbi:sulfite exporter TauE/SafE family protein [Glaciecola sp. MF2-115]|uniref:sulfite exporter TauE/SafE family protein n=1 Tax=Glaciecola sp. MF2-115 TaxID=3384827 RepID=UPI0039A190D2